MASEKLKTAANTEIGTRVNPSQVQSLASSMPEDSVEREKRKGEISTGFIPELRAEVREKIEQVKRWGGEKADSFKTTIQKHKNFVDTFKIAEIFSPYQLELNFSDDTTPEEYSIIAKKILELAPKISNWKTLLSRTIEKITQQYDIEFHVAQASDIKDSISRFFQFVADNQGKIETLNEKEITIQNNHNKNGTFFILRKKEEKNTIAENMDYFDEKLKNISPYFYPWGKEKIQGISQDVVGLSKFYRNALREKIFGEKQEIRDQEAEISPSIRKKISDALLGKYLQFTWSQKFQNEIK